MTNEDEKITSGPAESGDVSSKALDYARKNSRLGVIVSLASVFICVISILIHAYVSRARNYVAAVPIGDVWEYPMVHFMNMPTRYEEDAKPLHVAQKFVRGFHEVDPLDFSQSAPDINGNPVMISNRVAELLSYVMPGTQLYVDVNSEIEKSKTKAQMYLECKCLKRFLVTDMIVSQPPLAVLRVEMIGRFVIFGQDGLKDSKFDDLGYKSIVMYLANDIPLFDRDENITGGGGAPKGVNPEGWYVVKHDITSLKPDDLREIREIRSDVNMKGAY